MNTYQFAGVNVSFDHFSDNSLWRTWQWKLDPYRTSSLADIVISGQFDTKMKDTGILLFQEYSGFFTNSVHQLATGDLLFSTSRTHSQEILLAFLVNPDWNQITLLKDQTNSAGSVAFESLTHIIPYVLLNHNSYSFHSVFVEHEGYGFSICADSGTGKTTHARMWRDEFRSLIINGDRTTIKIQDDTCIGYGLPWSGTSGEQIHRSVPMKAMVVLERGDQNKTIRLSGIEAFFALLPHLQYPSWDKSLATKAMDGLEQMISQISVIRLRCLPNTDAAYVLKEALENL